MVKQSGQRAKGDGSLYQEASGRWIGSVDLGYRNGKRVRKRVTARTQSECRRKLNALIRSLEDGVIDGNSKLVEWLDYWVNEIASNEIAAQTLYSYRNKINRYVVPAIGDIKLQALRPDHIRTVHRKMRSDGLSESTIRQTHAILSRALKIAEREDKIKRNPCSLMDSPSAPRNPHQVLTVDEARSVLAVAQDHRELARLTCAIILGIRQGEALALRWSDFNADRLTLSIDESVSRIPGKGWVTKGPKTEAGRRLIPVPHAVVAILQAWKASSKAKPGEYVFPGLRGDKPDDNKRDWKVWRDALHRAEVHHVPLHSARGTSASMLLEMGVSEKVIADILGHSSVIVTREHYLHSSEDQRGRALDGLAERLAIAPLG